MTASMRALALGRAAVLAALLTFSHAALAATVPDGFGESLIAGGLTNPTAMQFAPDGRLFVCEQGGTLRVIKNGTLLATPFVSLTVNAAGERGLLGVAFDPNFAVNGFVYVYYTATLPAIHNRISRFTANGDVAMPGSEVALLDLPNLSATNHNGGALAFGPDGKLYAGVGENAVGANAQSLATPLGKMLRINSDGSIPADNPFFGSTTGTSRAIWALGLRNPFTFAFDPNGARMFINDVGQNTWEEIDLGTAGANYGWPATEGPTSNPSFVSPTYAYTHAGGECAITGGTFYRPSAAQFPAEYTGTYFFADLCAGWIKNLDPANGNAVTSFATGISVPVDLKVAADGTLYYLSRGAGAVYRIAYQPPLPGALYQLWWQHRGTGNLSAWNMNGTGLAAGVAPSPSRVADPNWRIAGAADFNGDGQTDLLWQYRPTGLITAWLMNGTTFLGAGVFSLNTVSDPNWVVRAVADLNGDGKPDLIWQHQTQGWLGVWYMDGTPFLSAAPLSPGRVADTSWRIVAAADFNGDGKPDLLWQNDRTGVITVWLMDGASYIGTGLLSTNTVSDLNWKIEAVVDIDGDGHADLLFRHQVSGLLAVWFMNGTTYVSGRLLTPSRVPDTGWHIVAVR